MKEIESIASALFDKIRSRFPNVTLGDESAKATFDPSDARFFNFVYSSSNGGEFGKVTISLIDETSLKVYFGTNISGEMDREQRKEWYEFLRNLRQFAKRNLLTFDTRDINKSNLNINDVKQQSKTDNVYTTNDMPVVESRLYGTPGRPYNSFADKGQSKLLIRHADKVNDEVRGARGRRIQEIFLETDRGERFLLNHTNLHGAYAMAEHINQGGSLHDEIAEYIDNIVSEMASMKHFVRATKHRQFEDKETSEMTQAAIRHYYDHKELLQKLSKPKFFEEFKTQYQVETASDEEVNIDDLRERFVKKVYDDRFDAALPIVAKAHRKYKTQAAGRLGSELDEWADEVTEAAWEKPGSPDKMQALRKLLATPLLIGITGVDATSKLSPMLGDNPEFTDLEDSIYDLYQSQGPDADATGLVKSWLRDYMPDIYGQVVSDLEQTGRESQTNWDQPTSPQQANNTYGATTMDEPVVESNDSLDFIRSLAGIKR